MLVLSEGDYQALRQRELIQVDFAGFPSMIRQLAEKCAQEATMQDPKFYLVLRAGPQVSSDATLEFQEKDHFKQRSYLSLKVCRGTDSQVKEYLAECIRRLQVEKQSDRGQTERLEQDLVGLRKALGRASEELEVVRAKLCDQDASYGSRLAEELGKEKQRAAEALVDLQDRYDRERRVAEEKHGKNVRQLENRVAALEYENKDLIERRHKNEAALQRLKESLQSAEEEVVRGKQELGQSREELDRLQTSRSRTEKERATLLQDNVVLRSEVASQRELLKNLQEQKDRLQLDLEEKVTLVKKREDAVKTVSRELVKANEVIQKFVAQNKSEHQKVKMTAQLLEEQEKILVAKDKELDAVREELRKVTEETREVKNLGDALRLKLKQLEDEKSNLEKKVATNEKVIDWLNNQLTTAQRKFPALRLSAPPDGITTFSSSGMVSSTPLERPASNGRNGVIEQDESVSFAPKAGEKEK